MHVPSGAAASREVQRRYSATAIPGSLPEKRDSIRFGARQQPRTEEPQLPPPLGGAGGLSFRRQLLRSEEHTSELQSPCNLVCRLLLEKKNKASTGCTQH